MDASDFIVPPPGIVPDPPKPPAETVRASRPVERTLPTFAPAPTGAPPPPAFGVPSTPPRPARQAATTGDADASGAPLEATGERVRWRLAAPAGADVAVLGPSVVGRAPRAADAPGAAYAVAIDDPARTVSKTHALIVPDGAALVVTDLRSTNGVRVERPGGAIERLAAGGTARVGDGEVLVLGELRLLVARLPSPDV
ncbi:FHA domain-containing protein [Agromyces soli]